MNSMKVIFEYNSNKVPGHMISSETVTVIEYFQGGTRVSWTHTEMADYYRSVLERMGFIHGKVGDTYTYIM